MAKKLKKHKLALPRVTRTQVQVTNALLCHLPQTAFEKGFKTKLKTVLMELVHADIDVWFDGVRPVAERELPQVLAEPTCVAIVGLPPRTEKALIEVDLAIAQQVIDKLLGGSAEDTDGQRPLSEIEDGVFSYVLLKVLQLLQEEAAKEKELALKLEGVHGTLASLRERFAVDAPLVCLSFKLFFDTKVGYCRVYLPESLVKDAFPDTPSAEGPGLKRWLHRLQDRIDVVRLMSAPLAVEVGRIGLQMSDVESLEVDDIVLVEDSEVRFDADSQGPGKLSGRVRCRIGDGHRGIITGALVVGEGGRYEVQIDGIAPTGEPRPRGHLFRGDGMSEDARRLSGPGLVDGAAFAARVRARAAEGLAAGAAAPLRGGSERALDEEHSEGEDGDDGPSPEAAGLLEDITVAMVVELGRVMVSAADVVQLRPGQVIELSRAPGEPVDLVVDGKRVGKGELVEIDGELGVRILSLVK